VDGVGSRELSDALVPGLQALGRAVVRVSGDDFLRPAGERFEWGREDASAFRDRWLDAGALRREVLDAAAGGSVLPALWDAARDRSARVARVDLAPRGVVIVDGLFLLGLGLPAEVTVHVALTAAALTRRGIADWQLDAFSSYGEEVRPGESCDVLVRAEDPLRPAALFR
jgi:uridine kinase